MSENKIYYLVSATQLKDTSIVFTHRGLYKHLENARRMQKHLSDQEIYDQVTISFLEVLDEEKE